MANINLGDVSTFAPLAGYSPLPVGEYNVQILNESCPDNKTFLELEVVITTGEHKNKTGNITLNLFHQNETVVRIAKSTLCSMATVAGVPLTSDFDTQDMIGWEFGVVMATHSYNHASKVDPETGLPVKVVTSQLKKVTHLDGANVGKDEYLQLLEHAKNTRKPAAAAPQRMPRPSAPAATPTAPAPRITQAKVQPPVEEEQFEETAEVAEVVEQPRKPSRFAQVR